MQTTSFSSYFEEYLDQLRREVEAYPDERQLWLCPTGISNSAGNLCTHLLGNLHHFIGHGLGDTGYVRNRPLEFSVTAVPRMDLLDQIESTRQMIETVLSSISDIEAPYPKILRDGHHGPYSIHKELVRLSMHLAYHLGQINYHRRLLVEGIN